MEEKRIEYLIHEKNASHAHRNEGDEHAHYVGGATHFSHPLKQPVIYNCSVSDRAIESDLVSKEESIWTKCMVTCFFVV